MSEPLKMNSSSEKRGNFIIDEGPVTGRECCPQLAGYYGLDWPGITALLARYDDNLQRLSFDFNYYIIFLGNFQYFVLLSGYIFK